MAVWLTQQPPDQDVELYLLISILFDEEGDDIICEVYLLMGTCIDLIPKRASSC